MANTPMPARTASVAVAATVVAPVARRAMTTGRSRALHLATSSSADRARAPRRSSPIRTIPSTIAIVAGTAPSSRTAASIMRAISTFSGRGSPWAISVLSSATTGRPSSSASRPRGCNACGRHRTRGQHGMRLPSRKTRRSIPARAARPALLVPVAYVRHVAARSADITPRPHQPLRRPGRRPGPALGRHARRQHRALARARRGRDRRARRRAGARARRAARAHARRRDEDRPGAVDGRLHARSRASEREQFKQTLGRAARRRAAAAVRQGRAAGPHRARRAACRASSPSSTSDAFAAASIGQVHRAGHARRRDRRRQGPVPRHGRGGRDRPAQPRAAAAAASSGSRPGSTCAALAAELRERVAEELDYEIEAQNHRADRARAGAGTRSRTSRPSTRRCPAAACS